MADKPTPDETPDKPDPHESTFIASSPFNIEMIDRARELLASPPEQLGPYRILERIGGGGMGEVFRAEQREPIRRQVAVKIIKLGMDTKAVIARFEAERQALALMDHPHIAKVFDAAAEESGRPYFVMEYVKGKPITDYADQNHLTIPERLELFEQVCQAIQHAHHKGIIHRDMKPSNVLVSTHDGKPFAKVIDFGIAKAVAQQLTDKTLFTQHDQFIGTPQYMSPEQAEGSLDIDTRTDVYSLGVLLYELLTGSTPFSTADLRAAAFEQIKKLIVEVDPPKPSTRLSQSEQTLPSLAAFRRTEPKRLGLLVTGELDWIVMKALEKDRKRRYETPAAFAQDILAHLHGEPVQAAPPSSFYQLKKFVRKHRAPVIGAAAVGGSLAVGIVGTSWGYYRVNQFARQEHQARLEATQARNAEREQRKAADFLAYTSSLLLTQRAIDDDDYELARIFIDKCPHEFRGWEWTYLRKLANSVSVHKKTSGSMSDVSPAPRVSGTGFSYLGKYKLESPSQTSLYSLNDTEGAIFTIGSTGISRLSSKGDFLLNVSDESIQLWNVLDSNANKPIKEFSHSVIDSRFPPNPSDAFMNPEGSRIVVLYSTDGIRMYSSDGKCISGPWDQLSSVRWSQFSPDGSRLLIANGPEVLVWDLKDKSFGSPLVLQVMAKTASFNSSGSHILTVGEEGLAKIPSLENLEVYSFQQRERLSRNSPRLWTAEGKFIGPLFLEEENDSVSLAFFTPRGDQVCTCSYDGVIRFWNLDACDTGERMYHDDMINSIHLNSDGTKVLTASPLHLSLWDRKKGVLGRAYVQCLKGDHYGSIHAEISPDERHVVLPFGNLLRLDAEHLTSPVDEIYRSGEYDLELEAVLLDAQYTESDPSDDAEPPDWIVHLDDDHRLKVIERGSQLPIREASFPFSKVTGFIKTPDSSRIIVAEGRNLRFFETDSWREVAVLRQDSEIEDIRKTPSGSQIILRLSDDSLKVLDIRSYEEQLKAWRYRESQRENESRTARNYVESLLSSPVKTAELRSHALTDKTLSPRTKMLVLELLDHEEWARKTAAKNRFEMIKSKTFLLKIQAEFSNETEQLSKDRGTSRVAEEFNKLVDSWSPDHHRLAEGAWDLLATPNLPKSDYQLALEAARKCSVDHPGDYWSILAIGSANYRFGNYQEALDGLPKALKMIPELADIQFNIREVKMEIPILTLLAMCKYQLGRVEEARDELKMLNRRLKEPTSLWRHMDENEIQFLKEAEALINPMPPKSKPSLPIGRAVQYAIDSILPLIQPNPEQK